MPARRALFAWLLFALAGCGMDDQAQVECRCTEATDLRLFPRCAEQTPAAEPDGSPNPFSTRVPDCPSGKRLPLLEPTRPENVLINVKIAFENLAPVAYMDQLSSDFLFVPDAGDVLVHREVYNPSDDYVTGEDTLWTRDQERRFAAELLDDTRLQGVKLWRWFQSYEDERQTGEDRRYETFIFPYDLEFSELPRDGQIGVFAVRGRMEVEIATPTEGNPVWTIRRWQDFRDPSSAKWSWTTLRAEFSR